MEESTPKEKVLKNVRNALISKTGMPFPDLEPDIDFYQEHDESLEVAFAEAFTAVAGKFVYCESRQELQENLKIVLQSLNKEFVYCFDEKLGTLMKEAGLDYIKDPEDFLKAEIGITACEYLIARLGSIMVSSAQTSGRRLNVFPETHIIIADTGQLVGDLKDALQKIREKYEGKLPSMISVITGPSRTADIEKTLVMGAHGPRSLYLFLVEGLI